jgi:hypothetical protein
MSATKMGASASNKPNIILVGEHDHANATGRNSIINTLKKNTTIRFFYESPITEGLYDGVTIIPLEPYLETDFNPVRLYMKQNTPSRFSDALYLMSSLWREIIVDGLVVAQEDAVDESTRYLEVLFSTANDELRERLTQFHNGFPNNKEEYSQFLGDSILQNIQEESNGTGNLQEIMQEIMQDGINPIHQLQILRDNIMLDTIENYTTTRGLNSETTFVVIVGNDHIEHMKQLLEARGYHITFVVETTGDGAKMTDKVKDMVRAIIAGKRGGNVRKRYKQTKKSKRRNKSKSKSKSKRRRSK